MSGLKTSTRYNLEKDAAWSFGASDHVSCKFFVEHGPKKCYLPNWKNSQFHWKSPAEEPLPTLKTKTKTKTKSSPVLWKALPRSPPLASQHRPVKLKKSFLKRLLEPIWSRRFDLMQSPKRIITVFFYYNYVHFYFLFMILMGAYIKPVDVWGRRRTSTGPRISFLGGKSFLEKLLRAGEGMLRYVVWCLWGLGLCFLFDICGSMRSCSLFCKWGDSPRW